jgi:hypothetical protein
MSIDLNEAMDKVTIEMLKSLDHGKELKLSNTHTLYHYTEDNIYVVNKTENWEEEAQVLFDDTGVITFELLT